MTTKERIIATMCVLALLFSAVGVMAGAVVYWDAHSHQTPCVVNVGPRDGCW